MFSWHVLDGWKSSNIFRFFSASGHPRDFNSAGPTGFRHWKAQRGRSGQKVWLWGWLLCWKLVLVAKDKTKNMVNVWWALFFICCQGMQTVLWLNKVQIMPQFTFLLLWHFTLYYYDTLHFISMTFYHFIYGLIRFKLCHNLPFISITFYPLLLWHFTFYYYDTLHFISMTFYHFLLWQTLTFAFYPYYRDNYYLKMAQKRWIFRDNLKCGQCLISLTFGAKVCKVVVGLMSRVHFNLCVFKRENGGNICANSLFNS